MAWPLNTKLTLALGVLVALSFGITPIRVINRVWYLLYHSPVFLFTSLKVPPPAPHTLKAAILNVTADFNELTLLIQDFLRSPAVDPAVELAFRDFLQDRAARSHPALESALDWILAIYKFAFPFLLISLVAKLSAGGGGGDAVSSGGALPQLAMVSKRSSLNHNGSLRHGDRSLSKQRSDLANISGPGTPQEVHAQELAAAVARRAS